MSGTATAAPQAALSAAPKSKGQLLDEVVAITEDMRVKLGKRWGIPPSRVFIYGENFIALSKNCPPDFRVSPETIVQFLQLCTEHDLNPARYEIRAFYDYNKGLTTFVMVDGWGTLANRQPAYDNTDFEYERDKDGALVAITSLVHRKDRTRPTRTRVKMSEWRVATSPQWGSKPEWMLEQKAFKQGIRRAFGFAGVLDDDDVRQMGLEAPEPPKIDAPRTKVSDLKPAAAPPDDEYSRPSTPAPAPRHEPAEEHVNQETGEVTTGQAQQAPAPAATAVAEAEEPEADTLTAKTLIYVKMLGKAKVKKTVVDMDVEELAQALDNAKYNVGQGVEVSFNKGAVNLIEAEQKKRAKG